jgi:ATP-dependent Clp protease, protease subunit
MWLDVIDNNNAVLAGSIYSGDGMYVSSDLATFLASPGKKKIKLNTPGGSVFDGFMIYNTIKSVGADVEFEITGLVASMGTMIMLSGSKIRMAKNSFMLTHAPSSESFGTADELEGKVKLLRSIEAIFLNYFANKLGKTTDEVKDLIVGDNWFNAQEAFDIGLVDELFDYDESPLVDLTALFGSNIAAVATAYDAVNKNANNKNHNSMKLNAKSFEVLGVSDGSPDDTINAAIEKLNQRATAAETSLQKQKEAQINSLVDAAVASGQITAADKPDFIALANQNLEMAQKTIAKLPVKVSVIATINAESKRSTDADVKAGWSFSDYVKKDPQGLRDVKESNPDQYNQLLKTRLR